MKKKGIMSYFEKSSFIRDYVKHNAETPYLIDISTNNNQMTLDIRKFLNDLSKDLEIQQDRYNRSQFVNKTLPVDHFFIVSSSITKNKRNYLTPYFEALGDITEFLDVNQEHYNLIRLFHVYDYRIRMDKLDELRNSLLSYKSLSRLDIRDMEDYDFILCLEKVFEIQKTRLTSSTVSAFSNSIDEQRHGIIHCILYTLSLAHGTPNLFFYKNIPSNWRNSKMFNSLVYHYVTNLIKIMFLIKIPRNIGDMIYDICHNMDTLWSTHHKPYHDAISSVPRDGGLVCISKETELHYFKETNLFGVKYSNDEILMINNMIDVENLLETMPEYAPFVLGRGDTIHLVNLNEQYILKRPDDSGDTIVVSVGSDDDESKDKLILKMLTTSKTVFDIMQIMTEFILSRVVHSHPSLQSVKKAIPYVYAIRDDMTYSNTIFKYTHPCYPTTIFMEKKKGKTLHSICKKLKESEMLLILFNLFCICRDLHNAIEFTHYDLHTGNIIVDMDTYDVSIIDTSRCRFNSGGAWVGSYFNELTRWYVGIVPEHAYPANDIFRITLYCYDLGHVYLDTIIDKLFGINASEIVHIYRDSLYSLPYTPQYKDIRYEDAIHIIEKMNKNN